LPPFDALVAFDTALRHGSMTSAATELGMTQSAVSHRVRRLEAFMGAPLMHRASAGLRPTPAGAALAEGLTDLLDDLSDLRARCRAVLAPETLKVGVGSALADYWLVRRLPAFAAQNPDVAVELTLVDEAASRSADVDLQVKWLPLAAARASSTQRLLFQERVFPVCHPSLLRDGRMLADPRALADLPLLHKSAPGSGMEWAWATWFERLGLEGPPPVALRFGALGTAVAAALQGAGVVLARSLIVHDALAEGRLVRVLPPSWDMPSSKAHIVRWPGALRADQRVQRFAAWLAAESAATVAASTNGAI
jgi:LysR family glycine cleavage system transcriptional activator